MKKVVYHGGGFGKEYFWFSSDKDVAASYGDIRMIDRGYSGISDTILDDFKAYEINIQNPYIIDAKEEYYMDIPTPQEMLDDDFWHSETVDTDGICEYAKKKGHDSVIIKNVVEGHGIYNIADDYVCFNKSQFKELYNNKEKVEELKKELHNLIKTYGKNLKDDNQFIEDDIFELYLKNPVKLKYKEISKFTAYDDYFMLGKENYMYEPYVIDKYEDLETIINAVKKEVKQPAMKNSKKLKESLEKIDGCFITKSPYDIVNLFKNKPKEYRVLYDKNIDMYMIGDAESVTHYDMVQKAYKDAYYYNMEDFIQDLGGTIDNYTEMGQSGYWDGEDDENFDAYLWYIVFSPNEEWELGTDGYNKRYDYPFGHVFTRGCDLSEIGLWDALGVPENSEKLNESADNLNDAFWKWFKDSKMVNDKGEPVIFYHGTNKDFEKFEDKYLGKRIQNSWSVLGHFFTSDEKIADKFSKGKNWSKPKAKYPKGAKVMAVYLNLTNPLRIPVSKIITEYNPDKLRKIREDAIKEGYDGLIIGKWKDSFGYEDPTGELSTEQVVAFYPNQIKAVDNKGTWSITSDNIYETLNKELERYL